MKDVTDLVKLLVVGLIGGVFAWKFVECFTRAVDIASG
jgi:hypothetical protein